MILDEAHNVEDSAREAASLSITAIQLQEVIDDIDKMGRIWFYAKSSAATLFVMYF